MIPGKLLRPLESLVLAGLFILAFRFPATSGWGSLEALMAFLFPALLFEGVFRGRHWFWAFLSFFVGFVGLFHWVPSTLAAKGGLPFLAALGATALLWAWEAAGFLLVVLFARWLHRRTAEPHRTWAVACGAALGVMVWENLCFHVYPWSWGAAFGGLPWLARSAAFLGTYGLSALAWGCAAALGSALAEEQRRWKRLAWPVLLHYGTMLLLSTAWYLLPRGGERTLDLALVQPNFVAGERRAGMEEACWRASDALLRERGLPRRGTRTLLLWPESAVLGRDDRGPDPRLAREAQGRGIAWLFGTEGGMLNLVRGEVDGRASFVQAKTEPMAFGERNPGPEVFRKWLDQRMGIFSQEPGELTARSSFEVPTDRGPLVVHPLICSEALLPHRVREGVRLAGGELLTNHTNDAWFERSIATDLHGAQVRLRAVEMGVPLVRCTLSGKSGLFLANGTWELWGEPMSAAAYAFSLRWRPVATPARSPLVPWALAVAAACGALAGLGISMRKVRP